MDPKYAPARRLCRSAWVGFLSLSVCLFVCLSICLLPAGCATRNLPVLFLLTGLYFGGFRQRCTDQGEIWQGGADRRF